jgi:hypothetical protein
MAGGIGERSVRRSARLEETEMADPAPTSTKDLRNPRMKDLFARTIEQQKRLGWSDAKLCEFATQTLGPTDPYGRLKVTTVEFLSRLRPTLLEQLVAALEKAR